MGDMYNKLFTKILDSSIWLAPDPHRLVWITLIAAMDENGIANFACAENLAGRARVSLQDTESAIRAFESPDPKGPEQEYEGRRIERIEGGWFILNAAKYRSMVTRAVVNEQARVRMQRHRAKLRSTAQPLRNVTPSDHNQTLSMSSRIKSTESRVKPADPRPVQEVLQGLRVQKAQ